MGERNIQFEWDFLDEVLRQAGYRGFTDFTNAVMERLNKGAREYGDNTFFDKELGSEVMEEALDIAGWGTLWVEQIHLHQNQFRIDNETAQQAKMLIAEAAALAVKSYILSDGARKLISENFR